MHQLETTLAALTRYEIFDSSSEADFAGIAALVAELFNAPGAPWPERHGGRPVAAYDIRALCVTDHIAISQGCSGSGLRRGGTVGE